MLPIYIKVLNHSVSAFMVGLLKSADILELTDTPMPDGKAMAEFDSSKLISNCIPTYEHSKQDGSYF